MTAVVVILAIALAGSVALNGSLAYWWHETSTGERAALAGETLAERTKDAAEFSRDQALAAQKKAEAERDLALKNLDFVSKQRNAATTKEADDEAAKVAAEPTAALSLADLNAELGMPLVPAAGAGGSAAAASADHGDAGQDAVRAAEPAHPSGAGRSS